MYNLESLRKLVIETLPERPDLADVQNSKWPQLLDALEQRLLVELQAMLKASDVDEYVVGQAANILEAAKKGVCSCRLKPFRAV